MTFRLKKETLENIANNVGCTVEDLLELDDDELQAIIEKNNGRPIAVPEGYTSIKEMEKKIFPKAKKIKEKGRE